MIQEKYEFEEESSTKVKKADSLFSIGVFAEAGRQYDKAFYHDSDIIQIDSAKLAYTHFQKARCAAKLKNKLETIELLERTFKCSPSLRDTLQAEMARPENDWKILEGNWYLREVLLKTPKTAPK